MENFGVTVARDSFDATLTKLYAVLPEVQVTASRERVELGGSTTLSCNVTRTNPDITGTYVWVNESSGGTLIETSSTLLINLLTIGDYGAYMCMVTNTAGLTGSGSITIEQGCKFNYAIVNVL